jgi:hypothetical protein
VKLNVSLCLNSYMNEPIFAHIYTLVFVWYWLLFFLSSCFPESIHSIPSLQSPTSYIQTLVPFCALLINHCTSCKTSLTRVVSFGGRLRPKKKKTVVLMTVWKEDPESTNLLTSLLDSTGHNPTWVLWRITTINAWFLTRWILYSFLLFCSLCFFWLPV